MGKLKNKSRSEIENARGILREYEKEIRSLRQQLRRFEKYERQNHDADVKNDSEDTHRDLKFTKDCLDCGKGKMVETLDLGARGLFGECAHCGSKGRMK